MVYLCTNQRNQMIAEVQQLLDAIQALPETEQSQVARELMDELRWDRLFHDPRSEKFFEQMVQEIETEKQNGQLIDLDQCLQADEIESHK
jgi:hypothetical protein